MSLNNHIINQSHYTFNSFIVSFQSPEWRLQTFCPKPKDIPFTLWYREKQQRIIGHRNTNRACELDYYWKWLSHYQARLSCNQCILTVNWMYILSGHLIAEHVLFRLFSCVWRVYFTTSQSLIIEWRSVKRFCVFLKKKKTLFLWFSFLQFKYSHHFGFNTLLNLFCHNISACSSSGVFSF